MLNKQEKDYIVPCLHLSVISHGDKTSTLLQDAPACLSHFSFNTPVLHAETQPPLSFFLLINGLSFSLSIRILPHWTPTAFGSPTTYLGVSTCITSSQKTVLRLQSLDLVSYRLNNELWSQLHLGIDFSRSRSQDKDLNEN